MYHETSKLSVVAKKRITELRDWDFSRRIFANDQTHGNLALDDEPKLERVKGLIAGETEKIIWEHEFRKLTREPNESGIGIKITQDTVILEAPSLRTQSSGLKINVAREDLTPEINALV